MQRDSVYYVQRGVNLLIGVNRLGTQSRVRSIYYLCHNTPENANTQKYRVKTNYCDVRIN